MLVDVVHLDVPGPRGIALGGNGANEVMVTDIGRHPHRLAGLHVGSEADHQARQPPAAPVESQICHSPPRRTGTRSPERVTPSTSISRAPIMKSMWIELVLMCACSASSATA